MRKLLNTLYVTNPDVYLTKDGENIVARIEESEVMRLPIINIESIVCMTHLGASPYLMNMCAERNIGLCFLTPKGNFLARVTGKTNGNVLLRRIQYRVADDEIQSLDIARLIIAGKIFNSRKVIERFKRDHTDINSVLKNQIEQLSLSLKRYSLLATTAETKDILRGIEGEAATLYFSMFDDMIIAQKHAFQFHGRNRRPPKDKVNCMLSFAYTLLMHEVQSALETVGLDPYVGFLHTDRPGRPSLALDLMEEFRAYLADRLVLSLINRKQIESKHFIENGEDNILMTDEGRKIIISAWQNRKKEEIQHPYLQEKVPIGLLPYIQAMLMARYLRHDLEQYPVFLIQ
ncbi:MAG: type I-C CRISPR-associated endonuclease Cas1 [Paludibacteraceae bacterium]|nr:type I-C CRISPR-associated endonuclease Cas1 [Paludibacteraceae bacterium]